MRCRGMRAMRSFLRHSLELNGSWARGMASRAEKRPAMKAFPVFKGVQGVLESNQQFVHHVTHGAPQQSSAQRAALAVAEQMERVAQVAEGVLIHPSETPMLLETLRLGSVLSNVRLRSGHLSGVSRTNVLQKEIRPTSLLN